MEEWGEERDKKWKKQKKEELGLGYVFIPIIPIFQSSSILAFK